MGSSPSSRAPIPIQPVHGVETPRGLPHAPLAGRLVGAGLVELEVALGPGERRADVVGKRGEAAAERLALEQVALAAVAHPVEQPAPLDPYLSSTRPMATRLAAKAATVMAPAVTHGCGPATGPLASIA